MALMVIVEESRSRDRGRLTFVVFPGTNWGALTGLNFVGRFTQGVALVCDR